MLMPSEAYLEVNQEPSNHTDLKDMHSSTSTIRGGGNRIPIQGNSFTAFLVQVRLLVAYHYEVAKVAVLFIIFSAVTGKLS